LALLGAYLVWVERPAPPLRPVIVGAVTLVVGIVVGVNAASDTLVVISGLAPFVLAVVACHMWARDSATFRGLVAGLALLVVVAVSWYLTRHFMSAAHVIPQPGANDTLLAAGDHVASNFKLWWQSLAVLGNGDFFGRQMSVTAGLALICAALSIVAVVALPRIARRELWAERANGPVTPSHRFAFIAFWCSSAILLSAAFVVSATPVDIQADRYLVGLIYAAAAVVPVAASARPVAQRLVVAGAAVYALTAAISVANGTTASNTAVALTDDQISQVIRIAERNHVTLGYAGYWEAAPITWASHVRVTVYPVLTCGTRLCPFYLHYISSWYQPRPGVRSFLLTDMALPFVPAPTPNLGPPSAVYHDGPITMYVYPYDLASRIS
jgi:hypothetical protein